MTEVRRYSLHTDTTHNGEGYTSMVCVIDGDYYRAEDYEALEKECLEQARLNGMGAEREAALRARYEAVVRENERLREALRALVQHEGIEPLSYLDKGIGTATNAGKRWLAARSLISASGASR